MFTYTACENANATVVEAVVRCYPIEISSLPGISVVSRESEE